MGKMIEFLYRQDYEFDGSADLEPSDEDDSDALRHSKVYALGEMYGIDGLKAIAAKKTYVVDPGSAAENFGSVKTWARHAYDSTPDTESNQVVRDAVIKTFHELKRAKGFNEEACVFLEEMPELCHDILMRMP